MKLLICTLLMLMSSLALAKSEEYRCQLAKIECADNGGRYAFYLSSNSRDEATATCKTEAEDRGEVFCRIQLSDRPQARPQPRLYHCYTKKGVSNISAIGQHDAIRRCMAHAELVNEVYVKVESI